MMRVDFGVKPVFNKFAFTILLTWASVSILALVAKQLPLLFLHESIAYGDSYILDGVQNLQETGAVYPPLGPDHLVPAIYSPILYGALAATRWMVRTDNPYIGPRLLELLWFGGCLYAVGLLTRRLVPEKMALPGAVLLGLSFATITPWVMQLRGDFGGICCALLALFFLLSNKPSGLVWAGLLAGLAVHFKLTFVAAGLAGCLWLALNRRWADLLRFALTAGVCSVGLYALAAWREPTIFQHILAMRQIIPHPAGMREFLLRTLMEPVFLFGLLGVVFILGAIFQRREPGWQLAAIFFFLSMSIAISTVVQAGAGINYFFEPMFASVPFAVLSLCRMRDRPWGGAGAFAGVVVLILLIPHAANTLRDLGQVTDKVALRNQKYDALGQALNGASVFSAIPDVTLLLSDRVVMEPLLLNYLVLGRGADLSVLVKRLQMNEFDVVVTQPVDYAWRGVPSLATDLRRAIIEAYEPRCLLNGVLFHLPKDRPPASGNAGVGARLEKLGCKMETCSLGPKCPDLNAKYDQFLGGPPTF